MYEQLALDIDVPTTKVWAAMYGEYGPYWDQENSLDQVYLSSHDLEWAEDIDGNVVWGDREEPNNWPERDEWFETTDRPTRTLIKGHVDVHIFDNAVNAGDLEEIKYLWKNWMNL